MRIKIKVIPRSDHNRVEKVAESYTVRVTAVPVEGKANKAAIKLLAEHFNVSQSQIRIIQGEKSRYKIIEF
ncbi:hypothetical protein A2V68_02350 [candidate division Kazan bacterium RBG_13_50_9]|uniref:UPF0235 protein A2V68_02350 n=1 Tax=candidate division Kazan bacterium RBG_13_50_9 TaxID=1798535 RepID=A0A1F4NSB6_UNCK3|nr:MAG: hypothetical protein A2V68_02350 [candidate division Kazan bacterium RBG_13_50_9]